jgi:hypothetical protein
MKIHDEHGARLDLLLVFGGFVLIYLALLPPGFYLPPDIPALPG